MGERSKVWPEEAQSAREEEEWKKKIWKGAKGAASKRGQQSPR